MMHLFTCIYSHACFFFSFHCIAAQYLGYFRWHLGTMDAEMHSQSSSVGAFFHNVIAHSGF